MKRLVAAALVMLMLLCMVTVSASPGSTEDPLISRRYLEDSFAPALYSEIEQALGQASSNAMSKLMDTYRLGYDYAQNFTSVSLSAGEAIALTMGASFILNSGSATLTITSGTVINTSTGSVVTSGSQLVRHQRYFCAENTGAIVTAASAVSAQVDGFHLMSAETPPPFALPFTDVATGNWFFSAVEFVFKNELFLGTTETTFSPQTSMTRAMFVTVLHRLDNRPVASAGEGFSDVRNPSIYYYDAVTWAHANNIVAGHPDGTFRPNDNVTREQMAAIMHRYAAHKNQDMSATDTVFNTFSDRGRVSSFAVDAMRWATTWDIIRGSSGSLMPQSTATRAEVAQIVLNYYESFMP